MLVTMTVALDHWTVQGGDNSVSRRSNCNTRHNADTGSSLGLHIPALTSLGSEDRIMRSFSQSGSSRASSEVSQRKAFGMASLEGNQVSSMLLYISWASGSEANVSQLPVSHKWKYILFHSYQSVTNESTACFTATSQSQMKVHLVSLLPVSHKWKYTFFTATSQSQMKVHLFSQLPVSHKWKYTFFHSYQSVTNESTSCFTATSQSQMKVHLFSQLPVSHKWKYTSSQPAQGPAQTARNKIVTLMDIFLWLSEVYL